MEEKPTYNAGEPEQPELDPKLILVVLTERQIAVMAVKLQEVIDAGHGVIRIRVVKGKPRFISLENEESFFPYSLGVSRRFE